MEVSGTELRKLRDDLHTLKDVLRRQQEAKHLEIREELIGVSTRIEELKGEIDLAQATTRSQQNELNATYTRNELVADSIARVGQRVKELEEDHLTHLEFQNALKLRE